MRAVGLRVGWLRAVAAVGVLAVVGLGGGWGWAQTAAGVQRQVAEKIAAAKGPLDINRATAAELRALPGMGDEYVRRVVAGRPYAAKNQLSTRGVLPAAEYERIRERIIAHRVRAP